MLLLISAPVGLVKYQVSYLTVTVTKALRQSMLSSNYLPNLIPFHTMMGKPNYLTKHKQNDFLIEY